jgi:RNA ligase (TIGR02306 family)
LRKTDQERVQNYWNGFGLRGQVDSIEYTHPETGEVMAYERPRKYIRDTLYEVTIKLDGSSMTAYWRDGDFGVCSRNLDLIETEGNSFWQVANRLGLREKMAALGRNLALQGELVGPSVQGNNDKLSALEFYVFDMFDIDKFKPLTPQERHDALLDLGGIQHVPVIETREFDFATIEDALAYAEGPSLNLLSKREGVVFKSIEDPDFSFKIVSNSYLLTHDDR